MNDDIVKQVIGEIDQIIKERDEARAEVERLNKQLDQAIAERTPHDYGILADQRDEARADLERLKTERNFEYIRANGYKHRIDQLSSERDEASSQVEQLKQALHDARLEIAAAKEVQA